MVPGAAQAPAAVIHPQRLLAVVQSGLLDTVPDDQLDDLVRLARDVTSSARAFFTVVDAHRSFWKSATGIDAGVDAGHRGEVRVEDSLSQILVATDVALVVEDARCDDRTRHLAVVAELGIGACLCPSGARR